MTRDWLWFGALAAVLAAIAWAFVPAAPGDPFGYDEADYMYAGTQGFAANFTDRNALPLWTFVAQGLELRRDPERRGDMSQRVRTSGDLGFYRHYHGPVYAYWIAGMQAAGVEPESGFRASGLILHFAGAIAIFWMFRGAFPGAPRAGAFAAALAFATNRTGLVTALTITQHVAYIPVCILALFAAAQYLRSDDRRWWYATAALAGVAFAAVELASVLIVSIVLSVVFAHWARGWKHWLRLLALGAVWFLGAVAVVWPKGLLQLGALKGYLYLGYMALSRRTFSPISPLDMWGDKFRDFPLEFVPLAALTGIAIFWRRKELLPFLIHTGVFVAVTMVVTLPYTHYHGSMMASACVIAGFAVGELWTRVRPAAGVAALALLAAAALVVDRSYLEEIRAREGQPSPTADVLQYARRMEKQALAPFVYVPTLHYYHPDITTVGYDVDWTVERLEEAARAAERTEVICAPQVCDALAERLGAGIEGRQEVTRAPGQALDGMQFVRR